ncbi:MAG: hypothetical protein NC122_06510 [Faecalibacterium sp.]|nr:hypothetical protein [Ruminococcus sp.]MCM1392866.1 hypothetical protein [Ruminococcus sp.]MCM1485844.1 hypothetical protein [Faecalibacterium sp.]
MLNIDQLYDITMHEENSKSDYYVEKELKAYAEIFKPLQKLNMDYSDLLEEMEEKLRIYLDTERRNAFKLGFKAAIELVGS